MMRDFLLVFLSSAFIFATNALCQPLKVDDEVAFHEKLLQMGHALPAIWENDLKDAIRRAGLIASDRASERLTLLRLKFDESECLLVPKVNEDEGMIYIGLGYLRLAIMAEQPQFFEISGALVYNDPFRLGQYYKTELSRVVMETQQNCLLGKALPVRISAAAPYFGISDKDYRRLQEQLVPDVERRRLGDYIGGLSVFFPLFHEAAHFITDTKNEADADKFAATVFSKNNVSPTFAIGPLLVFMYSGGDKYSGANSPSASLGCRVSNILQNDDAIRADFAVYELAQFAGRAEELRVKLAQTFSNDCGTEAAPRPSWWQSFKAEFGRMACKFRGLVLQESGCST